MSNRQNETVNNDESDNLLVPQEEAGAVSFLFLIRFFFFHSENDYPPALQFKELCILQC